MSLAVISSVLNSPKRRIEMCGGLCAEAAQRGSLAGYPRNRLMT